MFAVVDIETTGGHANANNITEIAIVLHNGKEIEGKFTTLVNPCMPIQRYVQGLTGITDAMVAVAPKFDALAENIYNLLKDRIFVAHNVNFDYSFVKHQLAQCGFNLTTHKLCTIRLTRKIFPNLPKYGLGTVCRELKIDLNDRHRAAGDALATAHLFKLLIDNDTSGELKKMIKKNSHQYLPPNLSSDVVEDLPTTSGVYYFINRVGKVIYVGKAKNIKKRVISHFSNNKPSKQKQAFLSGIYNISFKLLDSEFLAALFESIEIKRIWPIYNKSQKHYEHKFGIFMFEDGKGYLRLGIDKTRKLLQPIASFNLLIQAHNTLWQWVKEYDINPALCFLDYTDKVLANLPSIATHNSAIQNIVQVLKSEAKTFFIKEVDNNYILVENGKFYGMGKVTNDYVVTNTNTLKQNLTQYPENIVINRMVKDFIQKYPEKILVI
jgi:DNA polymerase-3 subunit epsilon